MISSKVEGIANALTPDNLMSKAKEAAVGVFMGESPFRLC